MSAVVNDFGPENDFPYWKPFLLAGTKREPIKQRLWEKTRVGFGRTHLSFCADGTTARALSHGHGPVGLGLQQECQKLIFHVGPSRLYGATCKKMLKFRDGPGVRDPRDARKSGFSDRKPPGTRATT